MVAFWGQDELKDYALADDKIKAAVIGILESVMAEKPENCDTNQRIALSQPDERLEPVLFHGSTFDKVEELLLALKN